MALLDEQLVDEWLNRKRFFTIRGIKCGVDEMDLLALRVDVDKNEYWHVEVQVSYRPIGYVGGDTNARRRSDEEIKTGVEQWVEKKFYSARKIAKRNEICPNAQWSNVFVHGVLRDEKELEYMKQLGITLVPYKNVLTDLCDDNQLQSSSVASNITDILKYLHEL